MIRTIRQAIAGGLKMAAVCALAAHAGSAGAQAVDKSKWPTRLTFASGPVGSFGFTTGSPWASMVGEAVSVPISVEATGGFSINLMMVDDGKAGIAMTTSDLAFQGRAGADWSKGEKLTKSRVLMVYGANVVQIYTTRKSGIKTLAEISGHSANPSRRRSGSDLVFRDLMDTFGIKPSRISNANPSDANSQLGDGQLDVAAVTGTPPHPAVSEFEANHDMVLIGMTDAERDKFLQRYPFMSAYDLAANTYKGQTSPVKTIASYIVMVVRADMPDNLAYALVKETFAKKTALASAHKSYAALDPKNILNSTIAVHPGAAKFYSEQGVKL
ncbi:MAG: TAXI family TRAP transporter solute-binding subunit, partial [Betaproteobacteria bacterium]